MARRTSPRQSRGTAGTRTRHPGRRTSGAVAIPTEIRPAPEKSAKRAGLRYVTDAMPGITRRARGRSVSYHDADGARIRDAATLERLAALAIPPAWTDVWICPDPNGHLQATGRDARGRKQYRYHPKWREVRDATKFNRMLAFAAALPRIRERVEADLKRPGLPREKVLATVVRLLECTCIRVGNEEYSRANNSYGLTTLEDQHATIEGSKVRFRFTGKSGKAHAVELTDRRLARIIQRSQELPGEQLLQYVDEDGEVVDIDSGDVNEYLREISGEEFTAKDFRTWAGTILAIAGLQAREAPATKRDAKSHFLETIDEVADQLHNTRAVCRKYYVHPAIWETYESGTLSELLAEDGGSGPEGLRSEEAALVRLLGRWNR